MSSASFYQWKAKYGGMDVSDAQKLKGLESENAKLKKLLAEAMIDNAALKDLLAKMYDLPRPGKGRDRPDDGSPPKCIRPLASGLLLQPGHDEIRARRSQINGSCRSTLFWTELTMRQSTVSSSLSRASLSARTSRSGDDRISAFIECARLRDDRPRCPGYLCRERDGDLVHVHPCL